MSGDLYKKLYATAMKINSIAILVYPVGIIFWVASIIAVFPLLIALLVEKFWGGVF